jgi:hypothetical protein
MAQTHIYKIRVRQGEMTEWIVETDLRQEVRDKIRAQLEDDRLTGIEVWADGRKLTDNERDKLIGDVPI